MTVLLDRRRLIAGAAGLMAAPLVLRDGAFAQTDLFQLGVASGEPTSDGFVIWARLAREPAAVDGLGGMSGPVPVRWEVATDEAMRNLVARGSAVADARLGYSVHVEVAGLRPDRTYFYRFRTSGAQSPVGRARTAPAPGASLQRLKLAIASCAHWEGGYFSAYRHMAAENPDLVIFTGDYIYDNSYTGDRAVGRVRRHAGPEEVVDLAGYRCRYGQYRTDPDLRALHAAAPCIATWDDHEVENDYAGVWSRNAATLVPQFRQRRAAAYQAFYENMPVRRRVLPRAGASQLYNRRTFGDLVQFHVLDTRQYRTEQPCPADNSRRAHVANCPDLTDPAATMLGRVQERWLYDGLARSHTRWNLIPQGVLMSHFVQNDERGNPGSFTDGWSGYQAGRQRLMDAIAGSKVKNPVVITGDMHAFVASDLKRKPLDPSSPTIAAEFLGTSITSDLGPASLLETLPLNPHIKLLDVAHNGYMACELTPSRLDMRYQAISDRRDRNAGVSTFRRFAVEAGQPGVQAG